MRKIEKAMLNCLSVGSEFHRDNTSIRKTLLPSGGTRLSIYLHDNEIIRANESQIYGITGNIEFTLAGWPTRTTTSRINAVLRKYTDSYVYTKKGITYLYKPFDTDVELDCNVWYSVQGYN